MSSIKRVCYTRNGTQIDDIAYQPCNSDPSRDSVCCGTNHQGAGQLNVANDACDPNGLCQNFEAFDGTNAGVKNWWRQGCTDPTWQSENCLKNVCNFAKWQTDNAPVQKCGDNSWCCGEKTCCSISSSLFRLAATVGPTATSSSSIPASTSAVQSTISTPSSRSSFSPTASASQTASPAAAPSSSGLSTGAKAGIGGGVGVVLILLVIIAFLFMKLRKRKQDVKEVDAVNIPQEAVEQEKGHMTTYTYETGPVEMLVERVPVETMSGKYVAELPGSHGVRPKSMSRDTGPI